MDDDDDDDDDDDVAPIVLGFDYEPRRSQDFLMGCTFFLEKVDDLF